MLKEMELFDSEAEKSLTGIETIPNEMVPPPKGLTGMIRMIAAPQVSVHERVVGCAPTTICRARFGSIDEM